MKKHLISMFLLAIIALLAANTGTIKLQGNASGVELLRNSADGLSIRYSIDALNYREVTSREGSWTELSATNFAKTNQIGLPGLPLMRRIISVPLGATVTPRIVTADTRAISLNEYGIHYPIMPSQESVAKCENLEDLPFVVNRDFYNAKAATSFPIISVEELGMMRGERLFALDFVPVSYNPDTKTIEVIINAQVEVSFDGGDYAATQELKAKTYSPAFERDFASSILNFQPSRVSLLRYPIGYVIVLPQNYVAPMQPFIDWKKREGYNVILGITNEIGSTSNQIKTYMQTLWNNATVDNPAPSYLLIVGDVAQVPSTSGVTGSHPTDLPYVKLQGTDYMPEMYFGRFSAITEAQVTNQVNKTMMHQQYTMPDDSYLGHAVMIAGVDASWAPTHANGQINYGTANYFNAAHGINSHTYLYPASGNSAAAIINDVSNGAGYVNYTAHGDVTNWSNPSFTITNINNLNNTNKSAFVVGNCCLTSKFDSAVCFAEGWLRAENKGGIIYIGGTNSTYWDEDYWWGVGAKGTANGNAPAYNANALGAYDALFHDHNEAFENWAGSAGSMVVAGNLAVVQGNSSRINYYWEIYSIMGDPSLVPYLGIPAQNSMQVPDTIFLGTGSIEINADPYSYVALSMNNQLHGVGLADSQGNLTLTYTPFTEPGTAQIVATRSLRRPLIANVTVVPNQGPYVTISPITLVDNNGIAEAGETIAMDLTFTNVGVLNAQNLVATVTTTSPWIQLTNAQATLPNIPAGDSYTAASVFAANIYVDVPDQHVASFSFSVTDGTNTWTTNRNLTISAPNVAVTTGSLFDPSGNGVYEPGETIGVTINITNTGNMPVESGTLRLIMNSPYASLVNNLFFIPGLVTGGSLPLSFDVTLANTIPDGTVIPVGIALDMGIQMINHSVMIPVGAVMESFESGGFTTFPWVNSSAIPWTIVSTDMHSGNYSAKSGAISHYGNTSLQVTMNVGAAGDIKFWRKVSSESGYDFLKFYIDNVEKGSWSGTQAWAEMSYAVTPGTRTFKWTYSKDQSDIPPIGSDCAWIDDITFPSSGEGNFALIYSPTQTISFNQVMPNTTVTQDFTIRNLGNVSLTGMISIPQGFGLSSMGEVYPNDYQYAIPAATNKIFTLTYVAGTTVSPINSEIMITTNDPANPVVTIAVSLTAGTSNDDGIAAVINNLSGNYPNPFNPETTIRFSIKDSGKVKLNIYNLKGQLVRSLINGNLNAGNHHIVWNGKDDRGNNVSSGMYLYRMETENYSASKKMMLMK